MMLEKILRIKGIEKLSEQEQKSMLANLNDLKNSKKKLEVSIMTKQNQYVEKYFEFRKCSAYQ